VRTRTRWRSGEVDEVCTDPDLGDGQDEDVEAAYVHRAWMGEARAGGSPVERAREVHRPAVLEGDVERQRWRCGSRANGRQRKGEKKLRWLYRRDL
jgi:hypothetical protein